MLITETSYDRFIASISTNRVLEGALRTPIDRCIAWPDYSSFGVYCSRSFLRRVHFMHDFYPFFSVVFFCFAFVVTFACSSYLVIFLVVLTRLSLPKLIQLILFMYSSSKAPVVPFHFHHVLVRKSSFSALRRLRYNQTRIFISHPQTATAALFADALVYCNFSIDEYLFRMPLPHRRTFAPSRCVRRKRSRFTIRTK